MFILKLLFKHLKTYKDINKQSTNNLEDNIFLNSLLIIGILTLTILYLSNINYVQSCNYRI